MFRHHNLSDFNFEVEAEAVWAVRLTVQDALNRADTHTLMELFTEDASFLIVDQKFEGKEAIKKMHENLFEQSPGLKLEFQRTAVYFPISDVAVEDVTYVSTVPGRPTINGRDTSVLVKRKGRWLISAVRDFTQPVIESQEGEE